jgi:hypothetical protein
MPGFDKKPVHMPFLVEKCGTGTGFSLSASFFLISSIPPMLRTNTILKLFLSEGQAVEA